MGEAIYDVPGLVWQGDADAFWTEAPPPDAALAADFLRAIAACLHLRGVFYARPGLDAAVAGAVRRLHLGALNEPFTGRRGQSDASSVRRLHSIARRCLRFGGGKAASSSARSASVSRRSRAAAFAPDVLRVRRLGDADHARPARAGSRRSPPAPASPAVPRRHRAAAPCAAAARRPGPRASRPSPACPAPRQKGSRSCSMPAVLQVVEHLVGGAVRQGRAQLLQVVHVEVGYAPAPNLPCPAHPLEPLDRIGERDAAAPVQQVEVDRVHPEPLQAALAGRLQPAAAGVVRVHLGNEEHLVPAGPRWPRPTTSSAPPSPYISAVSISVMPRSRPRRSAAASRAAVGAALAHVPGALAERRHLGPVRQSHARPFRGPPPSPYDRRHAPHRNPARPAAPWRRCPPPRRPWTRRSAPGACPAPRTA